MERFVSEQSEILLSISANVVERHKKDMEAALLYLSKDKNLPDMFENPATHNRIKANWDLAHNFFPDRAWIYYGDERNRLAVIPEWDVNDNYDCRIRPWYVKAMSMESPKVVWPEPFRDYISGLYNMSAAIKIVDQDGNDRGVLAIDTLMNRFLGLLVSQASTHEIPIFIANYEGQILGKNNFNNVDDSSESIMGAANWTDIIQTKKSGYISIDNGNNYYVSIINISSLSFILGSLLPEKMLHDEANSIRKIIQYAFITGLFIALILAWIFSNYLAKNIERLHQYTQTITLKNSKLSICVSGKDELYHLNTSINDMLIETRQLNDQLLEQGFKDSLLQAELKFLQAQIKPHFLYNALNTCISISRYDMDRARSLLKEFSNYLRHSFDFKGLGQLISLKNEIELVQTYLNIEKARFEERLEVVFDIKITDRFAIQVPVLVLQPVIENAVIHGVLPLREGGRVVVSIKEEFGWIIFKVKDNGVGFNAGQYFTELEDKTSTTGIGISNIHTRLKKLYGKGLEINSSPETGTVVEWAVKKGKENNANCALN